MKSHPFPIPDEKKRSESTIVIAGGAGFIGSHLVDYFLKEKYRVLSVDNFVTGNRKNFGHHRGNPLFHFLEHDVIQTIPIAVNLQPVAAVLHFASPASPVDYLRYPIETLQVGAMGTYETLELARRQGARFLLASTSEVYGDPLVNPQSETYWGNVNPVGPRSVYDEAKRFAEALTMAYQRNRGVDTKIVRIFNTYGPRMQLADGRAVPAFLSQCLSGQDLTVFGDGSQTRSFCYVSDLVAGIVKLLGHDTHDPVNLGNPDEMSILHLAKAIQNLIGAQSKIVFKDLPIDDPKVRCPDISRAQKLLQWQPKVSFQEGMKKTLEYFREEVTNVTRL